MGSILTRKNLLSVIKFGLENSHLLNPKSPRYRIKELRVINEDSLECNFYSVSKESIEIKKEITGIMGCLNGFFRNGEYKKIEFKYYCVSALDEDDNELLYAISSKETAELIGTNSIEWFKLTYFQENTNDYRVGQAKVIISEIENTIRDTICNVLQSKHQNNWWEKYIDRKIKKATENLYKRQFGESTSEGNILINYTFTLDLKKIIASSWNDFSHLFTNRDTFERCMDELNNIRREEAHNRPISHEQLERLKKVHIDLLTHIFESYPTIQSNYLIENWKLKTQKIVGYGFQSYTTVNEEGEYTSDKILKKSNNLINRIEEIVTELKSVIVPIQKRAKHEKLISLFNHSIEIERKRIDSLTSGLPKSEEIIQMTTEHHVNMDTFIESFLLEEA